MRDRLSARHIEVLERRLCFLKERAASHRGDASHDRAEIGALKMALALLDERTLTLRDAIRDPLFRDRSHWAVVRLVDRTFLFDCFVRIDPNGDLEWCEAAYAGSADWSTNFTAQDFDQTAVLAPAERCIRVAKP